MRKLFLLFCGTLLSVATLSAQTFSDALRYSSITPGGSARFIGVGGALGPLGADMSVISTNPAGIAWLRRSQLSVTPGFHFVSVDSKLTNGERNETFDDTHANFVLPSAGIVIVSQPASPNWSTFNFGIGFNRIADFNRNFFYRGISQGSIIDRFAERANSVGLDDIEAGLAFDAEALFGDDTDGYFSDFDLGPADAQVEREQTIMRRGSINELSFAFAGNYRERVLWGLSIGVPILSYREDKQYEEENVSGQVPNFGDLTYTENIATTGQGINLKLGLIFRITQELRLGLAAHTPTFYQLSDNYASSLVYNYRFDNQDQQGRATAPDGFFEYGLNTPWRLSGGFGYLFGRNGFLSAEVEYLNFASANFRYEGFADAEREVNNAIDDNLQSALNFRVGGEYAKGVLRLRGGVALQKAGLQGDDTYNKLYSIGAGLNRDNFAVDLTWRSTVALETYSPYLTFEANQQFVDNDIRQSQLLLSFSFSF